MRTILSTVLAPLAAFGCAVAQTPATAGASDEALIVRARAIHDRVITLDTHKDISSLLAKEPPSDPKTRERFRQSHDPTVRGDQQVDFPKMREGGLDCAFFIVYVGQRQLNPAAFKRAKDSALAKFEAIHRMARRFPEHIEIAYSPSDVERIAAAGKLIACIGIENGYPMGDDPANVERFWELGARYMSITHNRHNQLGDSHTPADESLHGGLSELGKRAIDAMNRVGIMVDVSHASKRTMLDAVAHSKAPVIASHSGCAAVNANSRNLDDGQLLALKDNGGVIQLVALGSFVKTSSERDAATRALREEIGLRRRRGGSSEPVEDFENKIALYRERMKEVDAKYPKANVADFVDHIDHATNLIGIDHVAIASDFDGGGGVTGWNNAAETFNVTLELVRRGYTEEQIAKIWAKNTLRVWAEVEKVAARIQSEGK